MMRYPLTACAVLVWITACLSGCLSVTTDAYTDNTFPEIAESVPVRIVHLNRANRPYEVIGHIRVKASEAYPPETIIRAMQKRCRAMGGEALSDITQKPLPKRFPLFFDYLNFYDSIWSAEVVVWRD